MLIKRLLLILVIASVPTIVNSKGIYFGPEQAKNVRICRAQNVFAASFYEEKQKGKTFEEFLQDLATAKPKWQNILFPIGKFIWSHKFPNKVTAVVENFRNCMALRNGLREVPKPRVYSKEYYL